MATSWSPETDGGSARLSLAPVQGQRSVSEVRQKVAIAIVLGLALVLLIAGLAVFVGLGGPGVPAGAVALVNDAANERVTPEEMDRSILRTARQQGLETAPTPAEEGFDGIQNTALSDLIVGRWVAGEAEELGIEVSDVEVTTELERFVAENFDSEDDFEQFKQRNVLTDQEMNERVRFTLLSERLNDVVLGPAPAGGEVRFDVSEDSILAYYEQNKSQYQLPESRDVRVLLNSDRDAVIEAKALLDEDDSAESWDRVARQLSIDGATRERGGLVMDVVAGGVPEFDAAVFADPLGRVIGPFETGRGFWVIQAVSKTPAQTTSLEDAREQIVAELGAVVDQERAGEARTDFIDKWRSRTICAPGFVIDRCSNSPRLRPENAAPVISTRPVPPGTGGTVGEFRARGAAQTPLPPLLTPVPGENLSPRAPLPGDGGGSSLTPEASPTP